MATNPSTWAQRVPEYSEGNPTAGEEATPISADALNLFRALVRSLAEASAQGATASPNTLKTALDGMLGRFGALVRSLAQATSQSTTAPANALKTAIDGMLGRHNALVQSLALAASQSATASPNTLKAALDGMLGRHNALLQGLATADGKSASAAASTLQTAMLQRLLPTGAIMPFAGRFAPGGWLLCDGTNYRTNYTPYSNLHSVIGRTYTKSSVSFSYFGVPDLRGRSPLGVGRVDSTGVRRDRGIKGGEESHTLTLSQSPMHSHSLLGTNRDTDPDHIRSGGGAKGLAGYGGGTADYDSHSDFGSRWVGSSGGGSRHNNMHPYLVLNYIIKF